MVASHQRRLRASISGDDSFAAVHQEEYAGAASTRERGAEAGDCGHPCLDADVLHAGGMGEKTGRSGCFDRVMKGRGDSARDVFISRRMKEQGRVMDH